MQYLTPTRVPPAVKIGVWGKKIAEARRNCHPPMRQAAAKFFANLSAEKRGDLQKHFDASSPPPPAYRRKYPAPGRAGRRGCRGAAIATLQKALKPNILRAGKGAVFPGFDAAAQGIESNLSFGVS